MKISDFGNTPGMEMRGGGIAFGKNIVFEDLDLQLPAGKIVVLLGRSGCGKTSLLRLLAGLSPTAARGKDITWRGDIRLTDGRDRVGAVTLMEQTNPLLPWASALENITIGSRLRGETPEHERALALLDCVGLLDRADSRITTFSGGMKQRVSLARALYEPCSIVLMDEPFASLDAITRWRLQHRAAELLSGRTCLLVTHDPLEALRMGDEIMLLRGTPARLESIPAPSTPAPRNLDSHEQQELHAKLLERLAT
ncbi:MAG: ATP-binding cassette domain-containing protein [Hyphomicrobiales bacterium]|nr:ATP-binding cassette domain-containing protein [Hyphomicrobiales bacterium]